MTSRLTTGELRYSDEWETPKDIVQAVAIAVGVSHLKHPFALDLAAAPETTVAPKFFSLHDSALNHLPWHRLTPKRWQWLNPPFSKPNLTLFTAAMVNAVRNGGRIAGILPCSPSAIWFQNSILKPFDIRDVHHLETGPLRGVEHSGIAWREAVHARVWWLSYRPAFGNRLKAKRSTGTGSVIVFAFDGQA